MNDPLDLPVWRKWWARSKAAWWNLLVVLAGLGNEVKPYLDDVRSALGTHWFLYVVALIGGVNFIIRMRTAGGLSLTRRGES